MTSIFIATGEFKAIADALVALLKARSGEKSANGSSRYLRHRGFSPNLAPNKQLCVYVSFKPLWREDWAYFDAASCDHLLFCPCQSYSMPILLSFLLVYSEDCSSEIHWGIQLERNSRLFREYVVVQRGFQEVQLHPKFFELSNNSGRRAGLSNQEQHLKTSDVFQHTYVSMINANVIESLPTIYFKITYYVSRESATHAFAKRSTYVNVSSLFAVIIIYYIAKIYVKDNAKETVQNNIRITLASDIAKVG